MKEFFNQLIFGNSIFDYALAAGSILLVWLLLRLIKQRLLYLFKKLTARTNTNFDDLLVEIAEKFLVPFCYLFINYSILTQLTLSARIVKVADAAMLFICTYYAVRGINFIIHSAVQTYMAKKKEPLERLKQVNGMMMVLKAVTWIMGIIMLADNLGYNVTTIIAGLGVGGIAIALAAQAILGDLFSYIVIFFDKPFEIGDFIVMGNNSGIVEKIGIKTSHVRSLDGQQLIMPNSEMVKSVIHNFKRLQRRRVVFSLGVVYYTAAEKLRNIAGIVKATIEKQENAAFDRVHLKSFGDFSINYEIVYYIESADYLKYMDTHHNICIDIFEQFEKAGIEFAFPTQTIFINNQKENAASRNKNGIVSEKYG